jgi:hypothetical protein
MNISARHDGYRQGQADADRQWPVTISVTVSLQVVALGDQMMMNCTCLIDSVTYRRKLSCSTRGPDPERGPPALVKGQPGAQAPDCPRPPPGAHGERRRCAPEVVRSAKTRSLGTAPRPAHRCPPGRRLFGARAEHDVGDRASRRGVPPLWAIATADARPYTWPRTPMLHLPLARAAYSIGAGRRFARGSIGIGGRYPSWSRRRVR